MSVIAFAFIFASLLLHSLWHFLCKSSGKASSAFFALFSTTLFCTMVPCALASGLIGHIPAGVLKYAFLGAFCGVLCDIGLIFAYRYSDISLAYPMARALPVFFTQAVTSLFGWGKPLTACAVTGMMTIFIGCVCMALTNGSRGTLRQKMLHIKNGLAGILIAAAGTTGYTVIDSFGIREITALFPEHNKMLTAGVYSCVRESCAMTMLWGCVLFCHCRKMERGVLKKLVMTPHPYLAGVFAALAYWLILVAMNYVTNVSFVQAFRQLSLPLSALLGFIFLKEKVTPFRWIALLLIMAGLMLCIL